MAFKHFLLNDQLLPIEQANVPITNIEYSYGYGVYETIRVSKGIIFFLKDHCARLMSSAESIGLEHTISAEAIGQAVKRLVKENEAETCNVKLLLIGGKTKESASLYIMCLNPMFIEHSAYKNGAHCISQNMERTFPGAKTLNMLPSYLAFRSAQAAEAYDALLIDNEGYIREGTRTNFLAIKGNQLVSPPLNKILPGVMRQRVLKTAQDIGFEVREKDISFNDLASFDSLILTSASSKILPIKSIDDQTFRVDSEKLKGLTEAFDDYLESYRLKEA